jgi:rhodanese-related sulfurtransferase
MFGFSFTPTAKVHEIAAHPEAFHLVDVRTDAELREGKLPNAIHIPLHLLPLRIQDLPTDKPVVFYCRSGARSGQACQFVIGKGFKQALNLEGGVMAWAKSGMPLHA